MKLSILTIGDEILIGQVVNTNSAWIANELTKIGVRTIHHSVINDEAEIIKSEMHRLLSISDIVISTGGLGPTKDDITKEAIAEYFGDTLIRSEKVYTKVKSFFEDRGLKMLKRNEDQAMIPSRCKVLNNSVGTAPGMLFDDDGRIYIALPGVPSEMKAIISEEIIPIIKDKVNAENTEAVIYKTLQTAGLPESFLAEKIEDIEIPEKASLAYLPNYKGVRLRIGAFANNIADAKLEISKIKNQIESRIGSYIFGEDDDKLSAKIGELLKAKRKTISVAESCTGGMLGAEFTSNAGSSDYFVGGTIAYSNQVKINELKVTKDIIDNFGAVSSECAEAMAKGCREKFGTDYAISITGIAGPDGGTEEKPVGLVYVGISDENGTYSIKLDIPSKKRDVIRERTIGMALLEIYKSVKGLK